MERVIVSIAGPAKGELDLEVPADIPVSALIQEMALALGWDIQGGLYADPPGRVLSLHEALAQAGVWDGARLVFQTQGSYGSPPPSPLSSPPPPGRGESPVQGWRPLDLEQLPVSPAPSAPEPPSPPSTGGFVWKRVDED